MRWSKKAADISLSSLLLLVISWPAAAQGGFSWMREAARSPDAGDGTSFAVTEVGISLPWHRYSNRKESLNTQLEFRQTRFDWVGTTALANEYYWLGAELDYRQQRGSRAEFLLQAEPGLMTDTNNLSSDAFFVNLSASARVYPRKALFWQFGFVVDRDFGDRDPYPLLAMGWKPNSATEVQLGFPYSSIHTRWSRQFNTYAHIRPAGGIWMEEVGTTPTNARVGYRSWKVAAGAELLWRNNIWLQGELGQLRNRNINASDDTGAAVRASLANNVYWQLGLQLRY